MEESIGKVWNKILDKKNLNSHEHERVFFADISKSLKVFYHLLGGDKAKEIHLTDKRFMNTKRSMVEKVTGTGKTFFLTWQDEKGVYLPASLAYFDTKEQNTMHYYWLIALSTVMRVTNANYAQANLKASRKLIQNYAGFESFYRKASKELLAERDINAKYIDEEKAIVKTLRDKYFKKVLN